MEARADDKVYRAIGLVMLVFLTVKGALLFYLAYNSLITIDEFQQGGFPQFIESGFYKGWFPMKTVLFIYFHAIAYSLGENSFEILIYERVLTAALGVVTLFVFYTIARQMGREKLEAVFIVCAMLAFSTFFERIFRVRSEPLALFFATLSLWVVTLDKRTLAKVFFAGLLTGAAFLTTQKSVYFNVALGAGLVINAFFVSGVRRAVAEGAVLLAGWGMAIVLYAIYFRGAEFFEVIRLIFTMPQYLAVHGGQIFEFARYFVWQTLERNVFAYALCAAGWIVAGTGYKKMGEPERIAWVFTAFITFFIFTHNQPWPYVFIWTIPFLALWAARALDLAARFGEDKRTWATLIVLMIFSISLARNVHFVGNSNVPQKPTILLAESLLQPEDKYYDGIGILGNRTQVTTTSRWLDRTLKAKILENAKKGDYSLADSIFAGQPKVLILTHRTELLKEVLEPYYKDSYVRIYTNVLVTGSPINGEADVRFKNYWEGEYTLYSADGKKLRTAYLVDGRETKGPVKIGLGEHTISLKDPGPAGYLLPADITRRFTIPPVRKPTSFFMRAYTY